TIGSSHVLWEGITGNITDIPEVTTYSPDWQNAEPTFNDPWLEQSKKAEEFTIKTAAQSRGMQAAGFENPVPCVQRAAQRIATLWRASFSAVTPWIQVSIPDPTQPHKFRVESNVGNIGGGICSTVKVKLTVTGGAISGSSNIKDVTNVASGGSSKKYWDIEANNPDGCTIKMEVIYSYSQPDLQYVFAEYKTGEVQPALETTSLTSTPAAKTISGVILLNVSEQMEGTPLINLINMVTTAVDNLPESVIEVSIWGYGGAGTSEYLLDCQVLEIRGFVPPSDLQGLTTTNLDIDESQIRNTGNSPLATAITETGDYIKSEAQGSSGTIILITNSSEDTCGGNPEEAARNLGSNIQIQSQSVFGFLSNDSFLAASQIPITLQVVGVNVNSDQDERGLRNLANAGNGQYFSATSTDLLGPAIMQAVESVNGTNPNSSIGEIFGSDFDAGTILGYTGIIVFTLILAVVMIRNSKRKRNQKIVYATNTPSEASIPYPLPFQEEIQQNKQRGASCINCGAHIGPDVTFCRKCGVKILQVNPHNQNQGRIFCTKCGASNPGKAQFCKKCGLVIES
ncbi:zinc ribbon domain-containing protein, partial [Chloroflexota bacterium]